MDNKRIARGFLGVVVGTFLSMQVAPSVSLAIYSNLMTPWKNQELIQSQERQIWELQRDLAELKRLIERHGIRTQ